MGQTHKRQLGGNRLHFNQELLAFLSGALNPKPLGHNATNEQTEQRHHEARILPVYQRQSYILSMIMS